MKSIHVLLILSAAVICIASADGVAEDQNKDRTGSPDGSNTCVQCHTGGNYNPQMSILIEDETGEEVLSYIPDQDYTMKITISSIPFPTVYGFQATALFDDLSNAGTFFDPGTAVQIEEVNSPEIPGRHIVEHSMPGFVGSFQVQWTAPSDEEPVTFYASAVTANGNNEPEGDRATNTSLVLTPAQPDGLALLDLNSLKLLTRDDHWIIDSALGSQFDEILLLNLSGEMISQSQSLIIDRRSLASGMYLIAVRSGLQWKTFKVIHT